MAASGIGQTGEVQHGLDGPILTGSAVQGQEDDIGIAKETVQGGSRSLQNGKSLGFRWNLADTSRQEALLFGGWEGPTGGINCYDLVARVSEGSRDLHTGRD